MTVKTHSVLSDAAYFQKYVDTLFKITGFAIPIPIISVRINRYCRTYCLHKAQT